MAFNHLPGAVDVESSVVPASEISSVGDATYSGQMASNAANRSGVQGQGGDGDFRNGGGPRNSLVTFHEDCNEEESDMALLEATTSASNRVPTFHGAPLKNDAAANQSDSSGTSIEASDSSKPSNALRINAHANDELVITIRVGSAMNIAHSRPFWGSNAYVACEVDGRIYKTSVHSASQNPAWDEDLVCRLSPSALNSRIRIHVLDRFADPGWEFLGGAAVNVRDMFKRAFIHYKPDGAPPSVDTWFVLTGPPGKHISGSVNVAMTFSHSFVGFTTSLESISGTGQHVMSIAKGVMGGDETGEGPSKSKHGRSEEDWKAIRDPTIDIYADGYGIETLKEGVATHCYSPYSLRVFSVDSKIRRFCYYIIGTSWFGFISFAAALSAFLCMALDYSPPEWQVYGTASIVEMSTMVWLLVEICAKCIATGAIQGPGTFLRSSFFNLVDAMVLASYLIETSLSDADKHQYTLRPFRAIRILRPLTEFKAFAGLSSIFLTLKEAMPDMSKVALFLFLFIFMFAIFGVSFYGRSMRRRCINSHTHELVTPQRWCKAKVMVEAPEAASGGGGGYRRWDGGLFSPIPTTEMPFSIAHSLLLSPFRRASDAHAIAGDNVIEHGDDHAVGGHNVTNSTAKHSSPHGNYQDSQGNCAEDLVCANVVNPPIHFDDIWGAFLSIVQTVSFDGQFEPVTRALQSEENYTALTLIYFCLISFFCRFVFFFLGVAIITNAFRKARAQVERSFGIFHGKEKEEMEEELHRRKEEKKKKEKGGGGGGDPKTQTADDTTSESKKPVMKPGFFAARNTHGEEGGWKRGLEDPPEATKEDSVSEFDRTLGNLNPEIANFTSKAILASPADRKLEDEEAVISKGKKSLHVMMKQVVSNPVFEFAAHANIIVSIVALASFGFFVDPAIEKDLATVELVTRLIFLLEIFCRISAADSLSEFFASGIMTFDFIIIIIAGFTLFAEIVLEIRDAKLDLLNGLTALRLARVVSVVPTIRNILAMALASWSNIINACLFFFAWMSMFAVCSTYWMGSTAIHHLDDAHGSACDDHRRGGGGDVADCVPGGSGGGYHRRAGFDHGSDAKFDDYEQSLVTLFQCFTTEHWRFVLNDTLTLDTENSLHLRAIFIIAFLFMSQMLVFNMFIAVFVENFNMEEVHENFERDEREALIRMQTFRRNLYHLVDYVPFVKTREWIKRRILKSARKSQSDFWIRKNQGAKHSAFGGSMVLRRTTSNAREELVGERRGVMALPEIDHEQALLMVELAEGKTMLGELLGQETPGERGKFEPATKVAECLSRRSQDGAPDDVGIMYQTIKMNQELDASTHGAKADAFVEMIRAESRNSGEPKRRTVQLRHGTKSWGYFGHKHRLRRACALITQSREYQFLTLGVILIQMVMLVFEVPARDQSPPDMAEIVSQQGVAIAYIVTTAFFALDLLLQTTSKCVWFHETAYLRDRYNFIDLVVLVFEIIDLAGWQRFGKALQPVRILKRSPGMRTVMETLLSTWRPVSTTIVVMFVFVTILSVTGMRLFGNRYWFCTDRDIAYPLGRLDCHGIDWTGSYLQPRSWYNPSQNFDNFPRAMMSLFTCATLKYYYVLQPAMDMTELDLSPSPNFSRRNFYFFLAYVICANFFIMNLFIAFILDGFNERARELHEEMSERLQYKRYMDQLRLFNPHTKAIVPTYKVSLFLRERVSTSVTFQVFSVSCVVINAACLAAYQADQDDASAMFQLVQNNVFFALLVIETIVVVLSYGWRPYLMNGWNYIDMISMFGAIVSFGVASGTSVERAFRAVRVLQLIKVIGPLRKMFVAILDEIPNYLNVIFVLTIFFSTFSVICVHYLGNIREGALRLGSPMAKWPAYPPNFRSFGASMYSIFLIVQGDDFHLTAHDAMVQYPYCTHRFEGMDVGDCGVGFGWSVLIFCSIKVLGEYVLINIFIGMCMDTFVKAELGNVDFNFTTQFEKTRRIKLKGMRVPSSVASSTARRVSGSKKVDYARAQSRTSVMGSVRSGSARLRNCTEAWQACSGGVGRANFMQICELPHLLRCLPQPLGYPRDAFGEPITTPRDLIVAKLMRAELNLVVMHRNEKAKQAQGIQVSPVVRAWGAVWDSIFVPAAEPPFDDYATFNETFSVIFYWRCPEMVPDVMKTLRVPMLSRVVETAHAITVRRLFTRWVALARIRGTMKGARKTLVLMATDMKGAADIAGVGERRLSTARRLSVMEGEITVLPDPGGELEDVVAGNAA